MSDNADQSKTTENPKSGTPGFVWLFRALLYVGLGAAYAAGGPVVRVTAAAAAVFAFFGDVDGGVRHTLRVVGLTLAVWLAPQFGPALGDWLAGTFSMPVLLSRAVGVVLAGVIVLVGVGLIGRLSRGFARRRRRLNGVDHVFGGLVGAAEGALLVAAGCWTLAVFETPINVMRGQLARNEGTSNATITWLIGQLDDFNAVVQADASGQFIRRVNPLDDIPAIQTARQFAEVATEPEMLESLVESEELKEIAALPVLKKHLDAIQSDKELMAALERRDVGAVCSSPQWAAMLNDGELYEALMSRAGDVRRALSNVTAARAKQLAQSGSP